MSSKITIKSTPAVAIGGLVAIIVGLLMVVGGAIAWGMVSQQLANERIYVSQDAPFLADRLVNDPLTAYAQAAAINQHALDASDGKTYSELAQDDPTRTTVMNAAFLRSSLFTSVVSFGVALLAIGTGVVFVVIGWALRRSAGGPPITIETDTQGPLTVSNQNGDPVRGSNVTQLGAEQQTAVGPAAVAIGSGAPASKDTASKDTASKDTALNGAQQASSPTETDFTAAVLGGLGSAPAAVEEPRPLTVATRTSPVDHDSVQDDAQNRAEEPSPVPDAPAEHSEPAPNPKRVSASAPVHDTVHATVSAAKSVPVHDTVPTPDLVPVRNAGAAQHPLTGAMPVVSGTPAQSAPVAEEPFATGPLPVVPSFDELIASENSASISRVSRSERLFSENRRRVEDERTRTGMTGTIPIVGETRRSRSQASAASPFESASAADSASAPSAEEASRFGPQDSAASGHDPRPVTGAISWQSPEDRLK